MDFQLDDKVTVQIPKKERTSGDVSRMPGVVTAVSGDVVLMYEVSTQFGTLSRKFRSGDMQTYIGTVSVNKEK